MADKYSYGVTLTELRKNSSGDKFRLTFKTRDRQGHSVEIGTDSITDSGWFEGKPTSRDINRAINQIVDRHNSLSGKKSYIVGNGERIAGDSASSSPAKTTASKSNASKTATTTTRGIGSTSTSRT